MSDIETARLWGEFHGLLCHHQKLQDKTPIDAANRIFRKLLRNLGRNEADAPSIAENCVVISKVLWTTDDLAAAKRMDEIDTKSEGLRCPVVIVESAGILYVIDGRRRVNYWVQQQDASMHAVLLLRVTDSTST